MKYTVLILTILFFVSSCKNHDSAPKVVCMSCGVEEELARATGELDEFEKLIIELYDSYPHASDKVIEQTDSLIKRINTDPDPNNVKTNKLSYLHMLRAEIFYKTGKYRQSIIEEINTGYPDNFVLACNYVKLGDFEMAKAWIDEEKFSGFYNYALGNYYEIFRDKESALEQYAQATKDITTNHCLDYKLALYRIEELNKPQPEFLNEIYYLPSRPDFSFCDPDSADNSRRDIIFKIIWQLPEVKNCKTCNGVSIYKSPDETKSIYYWVKVYEDKKTHNYTQFNFYVDTINLEIKYYDTRTNNILTLAEWRKQK